MNKAKPKSVEIKESIDENVGAIFRTASLAVAALLDFYKLSEMNFECSEQVGNRHKLTLILEKLEEGEEHE